MRVLALHKVDDVNMEFHMDMYFRQFWNDKRLAFGQSANPPVSKIKHASLKDIVWVPDPFFVNQKEGKVLDNPADNTLFSIDKDGKFKNFSIIQAQNTYFGLPLGNDIS